MEQTTEQIPVSLWRRLAALYIDYLLWGVPLALLIWILEETIPGISDFSPMLKFIMFLIVEFVFLGIFRWSMGYYCLGIGFPEALHENQQAQSTPMIVDQRIYTIDRWWTILLGIYLILDGAKAMVRWSMWLPPAPLFGIQTDEYYTAMIFLGLGVLLIIAGICVLRVLVWGPLMGIAIYGTMLLSTYLNLPIMDEYVAKYVTFRRQFQGLSVRTGEIEMMQTIMPPAEFLGAFALVALSLVTLIYYFRKIPTT